MKAGFQNCDAIVYGPNMSVSNYVYDSQLISDIMVLQSWYNQEQSTARLHILAPARDPFTAHTVQHVLKDFGDAQLRLQKVLKQRPELPHLIVFCQGLYSRMRLAQHPVSRTC